MSAAGMVVGSRSTGRYGFKCGCCTLNNPKDGRGKDAERRTIKRRERQAWKKALDTERAGV